MFLSDTMHSEVVVSVLHYCCILQLFSDVLSVVLSGFDWFPWKGLVDRGIDEVIIQHDPSKSWFCLVCISRIGGQNHTIEEVNAGDVTSMSVLVSPEIRNNYRRIVCSCLLIQLFVISFLSPPHTHTYIVCILRVRAGRVLLRIWYIILTVWDAHTALFAPQPILTSQWLGSVGFLETAPANRNLVICIYI